MRNWHVFTTYVHKIGCVHLVIPLCLFYKAYFHSALLYVIDEFTHGGWVLVNFDMPLDSTLNIWRYGGAYSKYEHG